MLKMEVMQEAFREHVDEELIMDCMRCGFCLPACPTYIHSGQNEMHSPRGRIALMKAMRDGDVVWDGSVEESFDVCLGCRACEPACPAGVQYGTLIEQTRDAIQAVKPRSVKELAIRKAAFDGVFADQGKMAATVKLVKFYQQSGLQKVTRKIGFLNLFPSFMKEMEGVLPEIEKKRERVPIRQPKTLKVAFFTGCLMDTLFQVTNRKTIELLEWLGCEVVIPDGQQCCGALHGHSGEMEKGLRNARRNLDSFDCDEYDYIVNNAGGCGAFLLEYEKHLKEDPNYAEKAERFSNKQMDISSLFVKLGMNARLKKIKSDTEILVTYQDSCHLRNVSKVFIEPRSLIMDAPGVQYKELNGADTCCGSAGIYNLLQPEMSRRILDRKMDCVKEIHPSVIVTSNPGCLMQMQVGIRREGLENEMQAVHIVDFLHGIAFPESEALCNVFE